MKAPTPLSHEELRGLYEKQIELRKWLRENPLCPDSPDGNHHVAPIGSDEEWMTSKAPCYYCGDKQAL